jgi:PAS domain S-box-containing protein
MRTACEVMTPNPKMIGSGQSLHEVIQLFLQQGITSSPVVNPLGEVLGVLTELSLVKAYMLHKAKFHKSDKVGHHIELLEPISYVAQDLPLIEVLRQMIAAPTHRLLVRDNKNKIVGIVSPKDLMRAVDGKENPTQNIRQKLVETEAHLKNSLEKINEIEKHLEVYQNVFHETPYIMHAVDIDGKIIMANKREHEILGYKDGELIGRTIFDLYAESMHDAAAKGLRTVVEEGHQNVTYTSLLRKDGTTLRCDIASSSLRDKNGKFISTISILRPVDSEELLRILNGVVAKDGPLAKYANIIRSEDELRRIKS